MIDRDDELRKLLRQWDAPPPDPRLDERVWRSIRIPKKEQDMKWFAWAAGLILIVGAAGFAMHMHAPHRTRIETTTNATGFEPIPDGAITVVKEDEKR